MAECETCCRLRVVAALSAAATIALASACSRDAPSCGMTPAELQQRYGISDAYVGQGAGRRTLAPGHARAGDACRRRRQELIIPDRGGRRRNTRTFRDADGLHPIEIADNVKRESARDATVVSKRVEKPHARHRSWKRKS